MSNDNNLFVNPKPSTYFTGIGMFNKQKKRKNQTKGRNWLAVHAHFKSGSGSHKDKKREANRRACRGSVRTDI
jgi:hypothetical protein